MADPRAPLTLDQWWDSVQARSVLRSNGCIEWTGGRNPINHYGQVRVPLALAQLLGIRTRITQVHRAVWVYTTRKPLTRTQPIEHLCGNRRCRNFDHFEVVTQRINNQRAVRTRDSGLHGWDRFGPNNGAGDPIL